MSTTFPGTQPSHQMQREIEGRLRGERVTHGQATAVVQKRGLDAAAKEYETFKLRTAAEQRAATSPERLASARQAVGAARTQRELDQAFTTARRSLRR